LLGFFLPSFLSSCGSSTFNLP
jgi:hypothetical protein